MSTNENNDGIFRPPPDWEAAYSAAPDSFFGEEPSQLASTALRYFLEFGGNPGEARALDLGSGEGRDTVFLAAVGFTVEAWDMSPTGMRKAAALLERRGVTPDRVESHIGDIRDFDYPENAFDLTLAANVFQFLSPDEGPRHFKSLKRATKAGGICAVGVFSPTMKAWGADIGRAFTASAEELLAHFPSAEGWLLLDRTDYWTYRVSQKALASFVYVIARKPA